MTEETKKDYPYLKATEEKTRTTFCISRDLWNSVRAEALRKRIYVPKLIEEILRERYEK